MRESFVFYTSFYEALENVPDLQERWELLAAICQYALYSQENELEGILKACFSIAKRQIDINNKRYENSRKGGRPPKTDGKNSQNQRKNSENPNVNVNGNVNENENVNVNVNENVNVNVNTPDGTAAPQASEESTQESVTFGYNKDNDFHGIDDKLYSRWQERFPQLDLRQELNSASAWLESHPPRKDIKTFLVNWLISSQKRSRRNAGINSSYDKLDGNTPIYVSPEERAAFDGF